MNKTFHKTTNCENSQFVVLLLKKIVEYVIMIENMFEWRDDMIFSYKKLWKMLIDRDLMKKDLAEKAQISPASIAKLGRNENVNTDILLKICTALECDISDIMEIVPKDE